MLIYAPSFTRRSNRSPVFERMADADAESVSMLLCNMNKGIEGSDDDKLFPLQLGHIHHGDRKICKTMFMLPYIFQTRNSSITWRLEHKVFFFAQ